MEQFIRTNVTTAREKMKEALKEEIERCLRMGAVGIENSPYRTISAISNYRKIIFGTYCRDENGKYIKEDQPTEEEQKTVLKEVHKMVIAEISFAINERRLNIFHVQEYEIVESMMIALELTTYPEQGEERGNICRMIKGEIDKAMTSNEADLIKTIELLQAWKHLAGLDSVVIGADVRLIPENEKEDFVSYSYTILPELFKKITRTALPDDDCVRWTEKELIEILDICEKYLCQRSRRGKLGNQ